MEVEDIVGREDGYKDVPNLVLCIAHQGLDLMFSISSVIDYYEEYDNRTGPYVEFTTALLASDLYDILIQQNGEGTFGLHREMIWRRADTGDDYTHFPPILTFNTITLEHRIEAKGDPVQWKFTLRNQEK